MKEILVIGTALIDHLFTSNQSLVPDLCTKGSGGLSSGGSLRNIAENFAALGLPVDFLAVWGDDTYAELLMSELTSLGITVAGPRIAKSTPVFSSLTFSSRRILVSEISSDFLLDENYDFPYENYRYLLTDNASTPLLDKIIGQNPQIRLFLIGTLAPQKYQANIDGMILNNDEFADYLQYADLAQAAMAYPKSWLVLTKGNEGLDYRYKNYDGSLSNSSPGPATYPVGSGDALASGLLLKLFGGADFFTALDYGRKLAQQVCFSPATTLKQKRR